MRWLWQIGALAILVAGGWLGLTTLRPPSVVPATAPATAFSAERALNELRPITKAPHAMGSEEHQAVLMLLTDRLRALGLDVEVQGATGFNMLGGIPRAAMVRNIIARRRGTHSTGALLLMAHYDAVPRSPGVGDDASGVATILETLRAIKGEALPNDLVVVFSDAEEPGLLGAEAFANLHPFASDVKMILNFDARGDRGPVYLFETSLGNAKLMRIAAAAGTPLLANSFTAELYRTLPNDTDLSEFLHAAQQVAGLNFAMIDGFQNYHSPTDDILHLDPRTLQHMGAYALPLTRAFGRADLGALSGNDAVYFNAPVIGLVHYSASWALPLALLVLVAVMLLAMAGRNSELHGHHGGSWGLLAVAMMLVVPTALGYAGWQVVTALHPGYRAILHGEPYNAPAYFVGFAVLALTLGIAMQQMFMRRLRPLDLVLPAFLVWAVLGVAAAIWLPGASFLVTWPLIFALLGAGWWLHGVRRGVRRPIGTALGAVPALFLFVPLIRMAETGLTMATIPALVFLMMLVLSLAALPIVLIGHTWRWVLPLGLLAGVWAIVNAELNAKFGPEQKRPDSLVHLRDADANKAWWLTFDEASDDWTRQALGDTPARASFGRYHLIEFENVDSLPSTVALPEGPPAPRLEMLSSGKVTGGRRVHFRITASGAVERVALHIDRAGVRISDMVLDGRALQNSDSTSSPYAPKYRVGTDGAVLFYSGMPVAGIDVECTIDAAEPLSLVVSVTRNGLPPLKNQVMVPRSNGFVSKPFVPTDVSIVTKTFRI